MATESADSPRQKPEDQDHNMKEVKKPKRSNDQENNDKYLTCNQRGRLEQQDDFNAMPSELQWRTPNEPIGEEDRAQGANDSKQHISDTHF